MDAISEYVKFRKRVEALKEKAMDYVENEAEAFYLLTVAAEEIKNEHLADVDDRLDEYYSEGKVKEDEDDEVEDDEEFEDEDFEEDFDEDDVVEALEDDEVEDDKKIQEQAFKIKKPEVLLKGGKDDKGSDSKTSS